jgi:heavy metal sensor kinase
MKKLSIGVRLTVWYTAVFAIGQLAFGFAIWVSVRHSLFSVVRETLEDRVEGVARFLAVQPPDYSGDKLSEEVNEAYVQLADGDYLQVRDSQGNWIYRAKVVAESNLLPSEKAPKNRKLVFEERELAGRKFLFLTQRIDVRGREYTVQTGAPLHELIEAVERFQLRLLLFAPLVLLAAGLGGHWVSHRALAPVDAITNSARAIRGNDLRLRVEAPTTGDELQRLAETINDMLARIESAFRRVTEFTADASHELRTPISVIRTEAEIALRKERTELEYRDALSNILKESERTSTLIESLLSLAREDSGAENLSLESVNLREVALQTAETRAKLAVVQKLHFSTEISDSDLFLSGDEQLLRRLIGILLDNAIKYTPPNGKVTLSLSTKANFAVLQVRDNGIGISAEDLPKIFERFYRADKARSREMGGAGLGLAIAEWIVKQHKGTIRVESSLAEGSTFTVQLPLSTFDGKAPKIAEVQSPSELTHPV